MGHPAAAPPWDSSRRIVDTHVQITVENLGTQVVDQLRRMIITWQVRPGMHLVESVLSEDFGVSRGPIRDALRQLESEGLVESRRRGVFAMELTVHDIEELYALRGLIELHAFTQAMANASSWGLAEVPLARMREAAEAGDAHSFARADLDFHSAIYDLSGQLRVRHIWRQYKPTFAVLLDLTNAQDRDLHPTLRDHQELLAAAQRNDLKATETLLGAHMAGSRERLLRAHQLMTQSRPLRSDSGVIAARIGHDGGE